MGTLGPSPPVIVTETNIREEEQGKDREGGQTNASGGLEEEEDDLEVG